MHLLFATNDIYVPHVATTLCSIFENNKDMYFEVHVLATDISKRNLDKLVLFVESYNYTIEVKIVDPNDLEIDISLCGKWGIFPSLKLYAADIYPNIDKMLYVDADMICLGSLHQIEATDMTNWYIAASTDEQGSIEHKERLSMPLDAFYGCAGLMYFNLSAWRKNEVRQQCFSYFNDPQNKDIIKWGEQDVINKVCMGHILELPIEFNMFSHYWLHHGRNIPQKYRDIWSEIKAHPIIVHYIDSVKPWFKDNTFPYKKYYWKYHDMTPWKGEEYGYSICYQGKYAHLKSIIKTFLHKFGIKKYDYCYDC